MQLLRLSVRLSGGALGASSVWPIHREWDVLAVTPAQRFRLNDTAMQGTAVAPARFGGTGGGMQAHAGRPASDTAEPDCTLSFVAQLGAAHCVTCYAVGCRQHNATFITVSP